MPFGQACAWESDGHAAVASVRTAQREARNDGFCLIDRRKLSWRARKLESSLVLPS